MKILLISVNIQRSVNKFIILVFYVNYILLTSNNTNFLHETKQILSKNFKIKDLGEAYFMLGIEIHIDRSGLLDLSPKPYIDRAFKRFNMDSLGNAPMLNEINSLNPILHGMI